MNLLVKLFTTLGSSASIAFGLWHFFVPRLWNWYAYIDPDANELMLAIRAINAFFSFSLVLFGALNLLFAYNKSANRFSTIALLAAACILWLTRLVFQLIYPQGSLYPGLRFGMLCAFTLIFLFYLISLAFVVLERKPI